MKKISTMLALLLILALTACQSTPVTSRATPESAPASTIAAAPTAGTTANQPVRARHGIVASASPIASRVGMEILQRGGNAIDAAVGVGLALAVTWPSAGNLGGGGFMMIRRAGGDTEVIDYRERAPLAASRDMYLDGDGNVIKDASTVGYKAIGVPGSVAGLALASTRHGKLKWAEVIEPARRLADEGFTVPFHVARSLRASSDLLSRFPESKRIFLRDGNDINEGEIFKQPELAATLGRLKASGPREFYEGDTARRIVEDVKANGGLLSAEDLKTYEPTIRKPLHGTYRGYEIITMPPPSSGGVALLEMLNMLEPYNIAGMEPNSSAAIHLMVEIERRAFADRAAFLGDTDFVSNVPISGLISKEYAANLIKTINPDRATPSSEIREGSPVAYESPETTHFTVIDEEGNVVSNTYTLNNSYGSGVTARGTGVLLNNEMDDFTSKPGVANAYGLLQSENNAIAPRKRPLSAMTPTIVLKDGKVIFALGSPGGPTIINTVFQVIVNMLDFRMNLQQAIDAPRYHHQWMPDHIRWEPFGLNADTRKALEARGHQFADKPGYMGDCEGVMIDAETGMRLGASDPRLGGAAVGY
jgi:gamma-glutamyltranspeptidase / glutathione hydrolase